MRTISLVSFFVLALTGCGITPIHSDDKTVTYQHSELGFEAAMLQAKGLCAKNGKGIKHERTDCGEYKCVSTFTCTEK